MKKKVLIVEDNPLNMRLMEMTLRAKDYTLLTATGGKEALDVAAKERPDLIIMDVGLPDMSGLDVTRKLRESAVFKHTPIIGVTAHAMKGDREKVIESGCDAYVSKPINTRELPEVIERMLAGR